jgi:cell division protein FtsL
MKKKIALILLCTVPALVFLNVWEVFRFEELKRTVRTLEAEQNEWLEKNKRMITGLAVLNSPARIDKLAREELKLKKTGVGDTIRILLPGRKREQ